MLPIVKENYNKVGNVLKINGVHGAIYVVFDKANLKFKQKEPIFLNIEGFLVPFFIVPDSFSPRTPETAVFLLKSIENEAAAKKIIGLDIYLPATNANKKMKTNPNEILDYKVVDIVHGELGNVTAIEEIPGNPLLVVEKNGIEIFIPLNEYIVTSIVVKTKTIHVSIPDGLLDL